MEIRYKYYILQKYNIKMDYIQFNTHYERYTTMSDEFSKKFMEDEGNLTERFNRELQYSLERIQKEKEDYTNLDNNLTRARVIYDRIEDYAVDKNKIETSEKELDQLGYEIIDNVKCYNCPIEESVLISKDGRIFDKSTKKELNQYVDDKGYRRARQHPVHRMIASVFIKNINNKKCVNHIDGNKDNNHSDNLEWVTNKENDTHARELGLKKQGLPVPIVEEVCERLLRGERTVDIAKEMNISKWAVRNIRQRTSYQEITAKYPTAENGFIGPVIRHGFTVTRTDESTIIKACELLSKGTDIKTVAKECGMSKRAISEIHNRVNWRNISKGYTFPNSKHSLSVKREIIGGPDISRTTRNGVRIRGILNEENDGLSADLVKSVCADLVNNMDYDTIAKKYHISVKKVEKIRYGDIWPSVVSQYFPNI